MTAGRPRKPTGKHKLDGTFRKDRHGERSDAEYDFFAIPKKPASLKGDGANLWKQVVDQLAAAKSISDLDEASLLAMCQWWNRYLQLDARATELAYDDEAAETVEKRAANAWRCFDRLASRFGMTPADRAKLKMNPTQEKRRSPLDALGIVG